MGKVEMPCLDHFILDVTFGYGDKPCCDGCGGSDGEGLACRICELQAHKECIEWSLKFGGHKRHPLKKVSPGTLDYTNGRCHFCRKLPTENFYHCSTCNFSIDEDCRSKESDPYIYNPRIHEHVFILLPRQISFTCNLCGLLGERNPYVCIDCDFMIHKDCIYLPRVISINRHDHRVSLTFHLGHGKSELCGVCQESVDWTFGGFSCKQCPSYAVHSKCATDESVWDGVELEDSPEEEEEILEPYKMINGEKEIIHFSHEEEKEHHLLLGEDNVTGFEKMRCDACILPLNDDMFYKCVHAQCGFFLHKACANLPRRKRHVLHNHKVHLDVEKTVFQCFVCERYSTGFRYRCLNYFQYRAPDCDVIFLDARCGSISEPFPHDLHPHPLYHTLEKSKTCVACGLNSPKVLTCKKCDFALDFKCATLPTRVKHRCDDHYLSLCHGDKNVAGDLWCDICETKTDPNVWFYTCEDCGVALHIKCVLGDLYMIKPECRDLGAGVIPNNGMTRPYCGYCKLRCIFPIVIMNSSPSAESACSLECILHASKQS